MVICRMCSTNMYVVECTLTAKGHCMTCLFHAYRCIGRTLEVDLLLPIFCEIRQNAQSFPHLGLGVTINCQSDLIFKYRLFQLTFKPIQSSIVNALIFGPYQCHGQSQVIEHVLQSCHFMFEKAKKVVCLKAHARL